MYAAELWAKFDYKPLTLASTRKRQQSQRRYEKSHLAEKKQREYRTKLAQYSNLYGERNGGIQKRQKHQEKYYDCRSPASLLVRKKTAQRARTQQNNERSPPPPQLSKHFILEIRQTRKENKGKEYEPG